MNIQETGLLLDSLQAIYREIRTGEDSLKQWQRLLEHWNCLDIQKAAMEYSRNYSKAPRPADLIRLAREAREEKRKRRRQEYVDGQEVFRCAYCRDSGLMAFETGDPYELACTPCVCRKGGAGRESRIEALGYWFDYPWFIWRMPLKETWIGDWEGREA